LTQVEQSTSELVSVRIVVPVYFHPSEHPDEWALLAERADRVRLAILNPAGGPGWGPDPAHHEPLARLRDARVGVAGYVDTDYGRRPVHDVLADLERYLQWYGVDGVCFDRAAAGREHLEHYAELARLARAAGAGSILFNHGAHPFEGYAEHAELLGTFEGPWTAYRELAIPRWTRAYPPERFYHVVHSVPPAHVEDAYVLATVRRASNAYVTDRTGANPYDGLPADWLDR
jgi:hypothetical protein